MSEHEFKTYRDCYMVYMNKGEVKVRKGHFGLYGNFVPDDKPKTYLTRNPRVPLKLLYGKVLCYDEDHLPLAISMVKENYEKYGKRVKIHAKKVEDVCRVIEKEKETKEMTGGKKDSDDVIKQLKEMGDDEAKLMFKLINGEITGAEYDIQLKLLKEREVFEYEFHMTAAEFKAIKHALSILQLQDTKLIDPNYTSRWRTNFDENASIRVELAVVRELLAAMKEAEK